MRDVMSALRPITGLLLAHSPIAPIGPVGRACCANASNISSGCPSGVSLSNVGFLEMVVEAEPDLFKDADWFASHAYPCSGAGCALDPGRPCGGWNAPWPLALPWLSVYRNETSVVQRSAGGRRLPVAITETGWSTDCATEEDRAAWTRAAYQLLWLPDTLVFAVTPFTLTHFPWKIAGFPWVAPDGQSNQPVFTAVKSLRCSMAAAAAPGGALPADCQTCLTAKPDPNEPAFTGQVLQSACEKGLAAQIWTATAVGTGTMHGSTRCSIAGNWSVGGQTLGPVVQSGSTFHWDHSRWTAIDGWSGFNGTLSLLQGGTQPQRPQQLAAIHVELRYRMACGPLAKRECRPGEKSPYPAPREHGSFSSDCATIHMSDSNWTRPLPLPVCLLPSVWPQGVNVTLTALGQCLSCRSDVQGHSCQVGDDVNLYPCQPNPPSPTKGTANQQWELVPCPAPPSPAIAGSSVLLLVSAMSGMCAGGGGVMVACNCSERAAVWATRPGSCALMNI